jgi:DNA polymerase-3 subunit chi
MQLAPAPLPLVTMQITFYFNVRNRERALCQLVGKALAQGLTVNILTESEAAGVVLDRLLWDIPPEGFLPHSAADDPRAARTPVIIDQRPEKLPSRPVLFNWTSQVASGFERCERLIEIVDTDEELQAAARERWRAYKAQGHEPSAIDMQELVRNG